MCRPPLPAMLAAGLTGGDDRAPRSCCDHADPYLSASEESECLLIETCERCVLRAGGQTIRGGGLYEVPRVLRSWAQRTGLWAAWLPSRRTGRGLRNPIK